MPLDEEGESQFFYDERKKNEGRREGEFRDFYDELNNLLEEYGKAAEERRKTDTAHLPLAVSVPQLIRKVKVSLFFIMQMRCKLNIMPLFCH